MNNKIKLAVAGAVLASASVANAGITWDAGEWTVDMNGNVNAFAAMTNADDSYTVMVVLLTLKVTIKTKWVSTQVFYHHG